MWSKLYCTTYIFHYSSGRNKLLRARAKDSFVLNCFKLIPTKHSVRHKWEISTKERYDGYSGARIFCEASLKRLPRPMMADFLIFARHLIVSRQGTSGPFTNWFHAQHRGVLPWIDPDRLNCTQASASHNSLGPIPDPIYEGVSLK